MTFKLAVTDTKMEFKQTGTQDGTITEKSETWIDNEAQNLQLL